MSHRNSIRALTFALLAGTLIDPALAQDQQADAGIADIVVTAQKRAESLQDTPISIVAFTADDLESKLINGLNDLRANVPNLQLTPHPNSAGTTLVFMRGVGISDDQITQDGSVAVYMDGVYVARSQGLASDVAELERVEVLRGPQGTLYGRNATGGAINFITRKPELGALGVKGQLSLGNYDYHRVRVAVNVPVGDTLAANLAYLNVHQNGFVRNPGTAIKRFGDKDREAFRADILWEPAPDLNLRYAYDRSEIGDTPAYITAVPLFPQMGDRPSAASAAVRDVLPNDVVSQGHSLSGEWDISASLTLRSITAYRKLDNFQNQDYLTGLRGPLPLQKNRSVAEQDQWSQEVQLVGDLFDKRLQFVLGGYYFSEAGSNLSTSVNPTTTVTARTAATIDNESWALFGQATVTPAWLDGRLHLTAGARISKDRRGATLATSTQTGTGPIMPSATTGSGRRSFTDFSPTIVIAFDAAEGINLYAKAVKGYKTGGFNTRASTIARFDEGFGEESLWSLEAGIKTQLLDNRVRFNLAGFRSKYKDIQINVQSDPNNIRVTDVLNAGSATVKGIEADLTIAPVRGLLLSANYGYLDTGYDEILDVNGSDVSAGYRFINSPKHSYALDANYELPPLPIGTPSANVNYTWQDRKFTSSTIAGGAYVVGKYGLLNARLSLADIPFAKGVRFGVYGRNLTDKEYYIAHFNIGVPGAIFGEPRTYGLDVFLDF